MSSTIFGKRKEREGTASRAPAPELSAAVAETAAATSNTADDGFEELDQSPPDLTGINRMTFNVSTDVDIQSPILLDILADKPQPPPNKKGTLPPKPQGTGVVVPKE